jgi:hypothetical protein
VLLICICLGHGPIGPWKGTAYGRGSELTARLMCFVEPAYFVTLYHGMMNHSYLVSEYTFLMLSLFGSSFH